MVEKRASLTSTPQSLVSSGLAYFDLWSVGYGSLQTWHPKISGCGPVVFRQLRSIAKSLVHLTRESNRTLVIRLGLLDPLVHLGCSTLRLWQRRNSSLHSSGADDILWENVTFCKQFAETNGSSHSWYQWCLHQWAELMQLRLTLPNSRVNKMYDLLSDDIESIAKVLCVTEAYRPCRPDSCSKETGRMNQHHELQALPPPDLLQCELCSLAFPHQMALRRHMRSAHDHCVEPIAFNLARDALDGLPTCRHCGYKFRYWQGLRQHISLQVCSNFRDGNSIHKQVSSLRDDENFSDRLRLQDWNSLIHDGAFQLRARQNCAFCNQWFPRVSSLGYHLQRAHPTEYKSGKQWLADRIALRELIKQTPCLWCGCVLARSSLPKHRCPVGVQLGALLSVCSAGVSEDGARGSGRRDPEHLWQSTPRRHLSRGACEQESTRQSIIKRPSSRTNIRQRHGQGQGQGQEEEEEQEGRRRRWVSTESRPYGNTSGRSYESPTPRHSVHDALSYYRSSTSLSTSNLQAMEVHERRGYLQARASSTQHSSTLCVRGIVQSASPARRLRSKSSHDSTSRFRDHRRARELHPFLMLKT